MGLLVFIKDYFSWHYSTALKEGVDIWKNFLWFISQFFSIGLLLKTLFQPFRRMREYYSRGFDPKQYLETLAVNTMMRSVGFAVRLAILALGFGIGALVIIIGAVFFLIWLLLPIFIIWCFLGGIAFIL
jgi:hypothetical protein